MPNGGFQVAGTRPRLFFNCPTLQRILLVFLLFNIILSDFGNFLREGGSVP